MAPPLFQPPQGPSPNSDKTVQPRVIKAQFGDGYGQRARDGLNSMPEVWEMRWNALPADKANAIEAFLQARAGCQPFLYVPPDRGPTGAALTFIADKWTKTPVDGVNWSISATFTQVFDL